MVIHQSSWSWQSSRWCTGGDLKINIFPSFHPNSNSFCTGPTMIPKPPTIDVTLWEHLLACLCSLWLRQVTCLLAWLLLLAIVTFHTVRCWVNRTDFGTEYEREVTVAVLNFSFTRVIWKSSGEQLSKKEGQLLGLGGRDCQDCLCAC